MRTNENYGKLHINSLTKNFLNYVKPTIVYVPL